MANDIIRRDQNYLQRLIFQNLVREYPEAKSRGVENFLDLLNLSNTLSVLCKGSAPILIKTLSFLDAKLKNKHNK